MSRFHEELVNARRRGTAPGQAGEPTPATPVAVTFLPIPEGVPLVVCSRCGSPVTADRTDYHAEWHLQMGY